MPTINQLVRKPRKSKEEKSKSPALNKGYNSFKKSQTNVSFTAKTWSMYSCWYNDTKETELSAYVNMRVYV